MYLYVRPTSIRPTSTNERCISWMSGSVVGDVNLAFLTYAAYKCCNKNNKQLVYWLDCRLYYFTSFKSTSLAVTQAELDLQVFSTNYITNGQIKTVASESNMDTMIAMKRTEFLQNLQVVHSQYPMLHTLCSCIGKLELFWLQTVTDDWFVEWFCSHILLLNRSVVNIVCS